MMWMVRYGKDKEEEDTWNGAKAKFNWMKDGFTKVPLLIWGKCSYFYYSTDATNFSQFAKQHKFINAFLWN